MKNKEISKNDIDTILIAEDSPTQAEQLKSVLEKHNYIVIVAKDGKEALKLTIELKPSLVISDIVMPEMNGYDLCKEIKSNDSIMDIPVILLTSLTRSEDVLEGISCGADNYLTKPYSDDYLITHIEQILINRGLYLGERIRFGFEILFGGKKRFVTSDQQQMLTLLLSTYEAAVCKNKELMHVQESLELLNEHLEELVEERTAELSAEIEIRKKAEKQIIKLNRVHSVLSNINQAIVRIHDKNQLLNDACLIAIDEGKFQSAWIGIFNDETKIIEISASAGLTNDYFTNITIEMTDERPIVKVLNSRKLIISNNINSNNSLNAIWKQNSLSLGFKSFGAFPLLVLDKVIGGFIIYSDEEYFFDEAEISLLNEMAADISFALEYIQKESERKQAEQTLIIADQELLFQNEEKEKRADELVIANKELLFQNEEKEKRADELVIANKELLFQNEEKEKRAVELTVAKERAEQSDKLKSEFLAQMSHEIRTPLNAIIGNTDFLNDSFNQKMDADTLDCFESIDLATKRIIRTIDLILNASELQTSGYKPNFVKIDLNSDILHKLYSEHQLSAKNRGLKLIYTCKQADSNITADDYSITQIFANLIDNAIKYTKTGIIEILLEENKSGDLIVEVKDTGIGISKEFLPRMFDPFVQEEQGYTRSYEGNGLGLTLVKKYCEINNAIIEVESEKNVGTTFRVIFNGRNNI